MMANLLRRNSLDRVCEEITSECTIIHLDQKLCKMLTEFLKLQRKLLDIPVCNEILKQHPQIFKELDRIADRAHMLVKRCCEEKWLRTVFMQACTSHSEEALDVVEDLEWCTADIWKIARISKQATRELHPVRKSFKECEASDRTELLKKLKGFVSYLEKHAGKIPLDQVDVQLSKFLLERVRVQVGSSIPTDEILLSLDYRRFHLQGRSPKVLRLGKGSAGSVFKTDFLSIQCARKDQEACSDVELQELAKQALKLSKLSHPHVIKLFGFSSEKRSGDPYRGFFLMELMSGSLYDEMKAGEKKIPLSLRVAVDIMKQIAKGVRYLHDNGVSHRDLKCDNILVSRPLITSYEDCYHIKVTDFDQAKFFTSNSSDLQSLSKPNVGTTQWRAPECYAETGKACVVKVNPKKADSYSFAMTCYELLSVDNSPFDALPVNGMTEQKRAILAGTRPPVPGVCPKLLSNLIEDCWQKEASKRPSFGDICKRLQDVQSVLLTGTLSQRKSLCDGASASLKQPYGVRMMSMFKHMAINTASAANELLKAIMPERQASSVHSAITEAVPRLTKGDSNNAHDMLTATKVVVGLDFGTTHSGVAYATVSSPNEIHTISWPFVADEVYQCKTLTAIYKPTPNGDWVWGYQARREYARRYGQGNGQDIQYFRELKQSLATSDIGSNDLQPVVEYLRKLGDFILDYLQRHAECPEKKSLKMDHLQWCITVPSNWTSDSKEYQSFRTCLVIAGLLRGQAFYMFRESDAAARHCYMNRFSSTHLERGDKVCVLDVGSRNVQCVFEDWDDTERGQNTYGASAYSVESLIKENFHKFICGKVQSSSERFLDADPVLDAGLEYLKAGPLSSITIPCRKRKYADTNGTSIHLAISSSDWKSIFRPLVDDVVSFLQGQLQEKKLVNVKRLYVVGGYARHIYLMEEIKKSFPDFIIDTPTNPGSAVCKGAVALGLTPYYSQFQTRAQQDNSSNSEGGGEETNPDGGTRDTASNQPGQPGSSQELNPSISKFRSAADSKGKKNMNPEDQMGGALPEKMLVALDFGTSQMGFAYSCTSSPLQTTVCEDHQRRTTDLYYELDGGILRLRSCGQRAKDDCEADMSGEYISKLKLHLVDDLEPELELHLGTGLAIDDVISDCLREYGEFILQVLKEKFSKEFGLQHIQWCLLVPSFCGESAKCRIRACMINAGLLRGERNVDGSPYPLVTVLETDAASIACRRSSSLRKVNKFMVASIGGGTLDMVIQEAIGESDYLRNMKEACMGDGGFYGSSCLDSNFLTLLSMKMGSWIRDFWKHNPCVLNDLLSQWEQIKVGFSGDCEPSTLRFATILQDAWRDSQQISTCGQLGEFYASLQLTCEDLKMVFEPVVQTVLERIAAELAQTNDVEALVLVGGFSKSPYLLAYIKHMFGDRVKALIRLEDSKSAVLKGALLFGLDPKIILSRIARKTYGLGMSLDFRSGLRSAEEKSDEVERFRIDVEKGNCLDVDFCVTSVHKPHSSDQKNMKFSLYSSDESYPRFTDEESVTKEWDFVVDISDSVKLDKACEIEIKLYYGRSAIEVEARAVNLGEPYLQLPVTFVVGAVSERNAVVARFAKKTYGIGVMKTFEEWDLPEYGEHVNEEKLCNFRFETYIQKGTRLDYFTSRTLYPIKSKQEILPFKLYCSSDSSPIYVTDDRVAEEGALEIDIRKDLNVDKDREVSIRMWFSQANVNISAKALNFANPEDRNLLIRLHDGKWESQVTLNLARHLRVIPLQAGALRTLQQESNITIVDMDEDWSAIYCTGSVIRMSDTVHHKHDCVDDSVHESRSTGRFHAGGVLHHPGVLKDYIVNIRPSRWRQAFWMGSIKTFEMAQYYADAVYYYCGRPPYHFKNANFHFPRLECISEVVDTSEKRLKYVRSIAGIEFACQRRAFLKNLKDVFKRKEFINQGERFTYHRQHRMPYMVVEETAAGSSIDPSLATVEDSAASTDENSAAILEDHFTAILEEVSTTTPEKDPVAILKEDSIATHEKDSTAVLEEVSITTSK